MVHQDNSLVLAWVVVFDRLIDLLGENEAGHYVRQYQAIRIYLCQVLLTTRIVAEGDDRVGVGMVNEFCWQDGVQDSFN